MVSFTKRQWLTLIVFGIADFCNAICVSLQAPFYPQEAERKGSTATEYGLVFGIFELVVFIISPIYGKHLNQIGPKFLFNGGIFTTGVSAILFGLLDKIEGHVAFITLSFLIRIVEAMGNAAFLTASFAIIAKEFPESVATTFASLETFFGLGLIVGPTVGGALYEIGGYTTPFAVLGSALFSSAIMTAFVLPSHGDEEIEEKNSGSILQAMRIPGVALATCSIVATSVSIGFLSATLEPHLRQFGLSPVVLGLMFVVNGGTYALTAPCFGWICDRTTIHPKVITVVGCILVAIGFGFIGPAPFVPGPTLLWTSILGLVIHGLGIGAQLVASFTDALRTSMAAGFPNSLETYGLVSGLWTSTFALGAFIGPSMAGILYDGVGFRNATMFVIALHIIVAIMVTCYLCYGRYWKRRPYKHVASFSNEEVKLISSNVAIAQNGGTKGGMATSPSRPIERGPGAGGIIIACGSYKNRYSAWKRDDGSTVLVGPYSTSYGSYGSYENKSFHETFA